MPCQNNTDYVSLTPVINADETDEYGKMLDFALESKDIKNVAITGCYGAGKSSVIKSYENKKKGSKYSFLKISLAAFSNEPEHKNKEDKSLEINRAQLIERSILQQMLYSINASELPMSNFKRIFIDSNEKLYAGLFTLWCFSIISIWSLAKIYSTSTKDFIKKYIFNFLEYQTKDNRLDSFLSFTAYLMSFIAVAGILWLAYKLFLRLNATPLKKVNLKNLEIEVQEENENSILNRYIDEILYFFHTTKFNVVVIEDLDRFCSTEIFVKLREINELINKSPDIKNNSKNDIKKVVFLYAIKDEMFLEKERTKFFDFIIPIIPTINSNNSFEKFKENLPASFLTSLKGESPKIDETFLDEVSFYIDDMRLLYNIVNEFKIYYKILSKHMNKSQVNSSENKIPSGHRIQYTKLLALIIYKNVYSEDFAKLHNNEGYLFETLNSKEKLLIEHTSELRKKIEQKEDEIVIETEKIEKENLTSVEELNNLYILQLIKSLNMYGSSTEVYVGGDCINIKEIFKNVTEDRQYKVDNNYYSHSISFKELQKSVDPEHTYLERKEFITDKKTVKLKCLERELEKLKVEKIKSSKLSLPQLLVLIDPSGLALFNSCTENTGKKKNVGHKKTFDLLRLLLRKGYIDLNYHDHISYFYVGSLSLNDNDFIRAVRDLRCSNFDLELSNNEKICEKLGLSYFSQEYILNITLIDSLIIRYYNNQYQPCKYLKATLKIFKNDEKIAWEFLELYSKKDDCFRSFFKLVVEDCPNFAELILDSTYLLKVEKTALISEIILSLEENDLETSDYKNALIADYISKNPEYLVSKFEPILNFKFNNKLKILDLKFKNIGDLSSRNKLFNFSYENNLYEINVNNIKQLLLNMKDENSVAEDLILSSNLTCILQNKTKLESYVKHNIDKYITNVFLKIDTNNNESTETIKWLLGDEDLEHNLKEKILEKQEIIFDDFENIQGEYWTYLLTNSKIKLTWKNLFDYKFNIQLEDKEIKETFEAIFEKENSLEELGKYEINDLDKKECSLAQRIELARFILVEIKISDDCFEKLSERIYYLWDINAPNLAANLTKNRIEILITQAKVKLESHEKVKELFPNLFGEFLKNNLEEYLSEDNWKDENGTLMDLNIGEKEIIYLLKNIEKKKDKITFLSLLKSFLFVNNDILCDLALNFLIHEVDPELYVDFSPDLLTCLIIYSTDTEQRIKLFTEVILEFSFEDQTKLLLSLPSPYSDIRYRMRPKFEASDLNLALFEKLKETGHIFKANNKEGKVFVYAKNYKHILEPVQ